MNKFIVETFDRLVRAICHPSAAIAAMRFESLKKSGSTEPVVVKLSNARSSMYVDPQDSGLSRDLYIWRQREYHATEVLKTCLNPGDTVLEIGANLGYFAVVEAECIGSSGRIYAVEPSPTNVELLKKNVELNGFSEFVDVEHAAMGDHTGTSRLLISNCSNLNRIEQPSDSDVTDPTIDVPMFTVDDFVARHEIDPSSVNMIRMDVEGYETKVFEGMEKTVLQAEKLVIFVEIHPWLIKQYEGEEAYQKFLDRIESWGLKIRCCLMNVKARRDEPIDVKEIRELAEINDAFCVFLEK